MTTKTKRRFIFIGLTILILCGACLVFIPSSPESRFRTLFADLSVGVPDYQRFYSFEQPSDAIKGEFFSLEFGQSETQFRQFASKLNLQHDNIVSSTGIWVRADSKMTAKYPWMLQVRAEITGSPDIRYKIHIEGRQPYD